MEKMGLGKTIKSLLEILRAKPQVPTSLADNQLLHVIYQRRSVRSFRSEPIPDDIFNAILEAGRLAPCGVNLQSWTFAVFDNSLWQQVFGRSIPFHADRAVMIIADSSRYRQVLHDFPYSPLTEYTMAVMNASLAAMNMNIAAEALGVASVMLSETGRSGILDAKYLKDKLLLPDGAIPLTTIVFGYARGFHPQMPPKLRMDDIVAKGQYQTTDQATLQSWLEQMTAGYNVSHPGTTFQKQIEIYQSKIDQAEKDLKEMVFYRKP
jgi:nitroreductase